MGEQAERVRRAADFLRSKGFGDVHAAFVLEAGLAAALPLERTVAVPFEEIPGFPSGTKAAARPVLEQGEVGGATCLVARGRVHYYAGVDLPSVTFPVRVAKALGARWIGLTSVAGALRPGLRVGDVVLVTDHLNLMGDSPLAGPNDDALGTRFPDLSGAYDRELAAQAEDVARAAAVTLRRGVQAAVCGPQRGTPAETNMLRALGADVVEMSCVPETIVAVHAQLRVLALAVVTPDAAAVPPEAVTRVGKILEGILRRSS